MSGRLGWWPTYGKSWKGSFRVLVQLAKGIVLSEAAIKESIAEPIFLHVDASDYFFCRDSHDAELVDYTKYRQDLVFLALDLVLGRVDASHNLYQTLVSHGILEDELSWFLNHQAKPDVIGYNMYPMFSLKEVLRRGRSLSIKIKKSWADVLVKIGRQYAERYPEFPIMITETACAGSMKRRLQWVIDSTSAVLEARKEGLNIIGYTFWPLFPLVTWAYQRGIKDLNRYILHMGLYDLIDREGFLFRCPTPVSDEYAKRINLLN